MWPTFPARMENLEVVPLVQDCSELGQGALITATAH